MTVDRHDYDEPIIELELADDDQQPIIDKDVVRTSFCGTLVSIVLHLWIIANLGGIVLEPSEEVYIPPIDTRIDDTEEPEEPEQVVEYELANPDDRELDVKEVINATSIGQSQTNKPKIESAPKPVTEMLMPELRTVMYDIPEGVEIDDRIVVKGTTGEAMVQIESALDRVTWEIAKSLEERKVLVVWMLDASGSVIKQRKAIAKRLRRIYGELDALDENGQIPIPRKDQPLLSAVVTFGETTKFVTPNPTVEFNAIRDAVANAPTDESGVENVFTCVHQVMQRWSTYRTRNGRRIMLITVTDEAGDDFGEKLEPAIAICRRYGARAYVIGPLAVFGRRQGLIPYVAPENGRTYQLPIDLGPETAMLENVDLPFWFGGPQYTYLSSGFAPYALARLVRESGGIYFATNMTTMSGLSPIGVFDNATLKNFEPDYSFGSPAKYMDDIGRHPIRMAVWRAAVASRKFKAKGTPALDIRVTPQNFKRTASDAQKTVAESQLMIDTILTMFPAGLEREFEKEPSQRWRMAYLLSYGRLLAQRTRCLEYNSACAFLKNELTPQDVSTKSNRWIFRPDNKVNYATNMRGTAKKAEKMLQTVIDEAQGTPWAVLAARELKDPFGIKIEQRFIPPPKPRAQSRRPAKNNPRPKFERKKNQQPQAPRPKPKPPVLPKL